MATPFRIDVVNLYAAMPPRFVIITLSVCGHEGVAQQQEGTSGKAQPFLTTGGKAKQEQERTLVIAKRLQQAF
jgi:hypothetical protein